MEFSSVVSFFLPLTDNGNRCCTTINRYPMFSAIYFVIYKVYTGYHGTSETEHGLYACTVEKSPR